MTGELLPGLLFDECVDRVLTVPAFAPLGAITFSRDLAARAIDPDVMALARDLGMILVTEDAGFGRLERDRFRWKRILSWRGSWRIPVL